MRESAVPIVALVPEKGVRLESGPMEEAFRNNIDYLKGLAMDSILYWFRVKAGENAPGEPYRGHFEDNTQPLSLPLRHSGQRPQDLACQPIPTRSPLASSDTFSPISDTVPTISWPGTNGYQEIPASSSIRWTSL